MARCIQCGHENFLDMPICEECYALLPSTGLLSSIPDDRSPGHRQWATRHLKHRGQLTGHQVAFYVDEFEKPIIVPVAGELILGRQPPDTSATARLDLTPYRAVQLGLSRIHAAIRRNGRGFEIVDLGSTNGTRLNQVALEPYIPNALTAGDRLRLALMWLTIDFRPSA